MTLFRIVIVVAAVALAGGAVALYVGFGAFLPWREKAEAARLVASVGLREGHVVAEIGAGSGRFAVALASSVGPTGRVYATELSGPTHQALSARTASHEHVIVIEASRAQTGLPDRCCDLIVMRNVYHHVAEPAAFLAEVKRAVRPDGRVVVIDFEPGALWFHGGRPADASVRRPGHGVSQAEAASEFTAAGFRVEQSDARWSWPMWMSVFRADAKPQ